MSTSSTSPDFALPPRVPHCKFGPDQLAIVDMTVRGQTLDIGMREITDGIGWGATLSNCELRVHNPNWATVYKATLEECRIVPAAGKVEDLTWRNIRYVRCTFEGVFRLCQLGFTAHDDRSHSAIIDGCDFSKARLDYCSIGNIDVPTTRWPESPHVMFFEPDTHRKEILAIDPDWPVRGLLSLISRYNEECRVVVISLPFLEEKRKTEKNPYGLTPEQFDRFLNGCRKVDFVRFNF